MKAAPKGLSLISILVPDYDPAIAWFRDSLGFDLLEDTDLGNEKRWVRVGRPGAATEILLARAVGQQADAIGFQGGGRVWLFLESDDFARDHAAMIAAGVVFEAPPRSEPYGQVAVFQDPWGGRWDLIQYTYPDRGGTDQS